MDELLPISADPLGDESDPDLRARVKAELEPGERLLWAGRAIQPPVGKGSGLQAAALWLLGLWSTGLVGVAYRYGLLGTPNEVVLPFVKLVAALAGISGFLVAIGLTGAIVAHFRRRSQGMHLAYALTDRRAMLWRPRPGTSAVEVYTLPARSLDSVHRVEFADGSGDIEFVGTNSPPWDTRGFFGIRNVRRVEALVRSILVDPEARKRRGADHPDVAFVD